MSKSIKMVRSYINAWKTEVCDLALLIISKSVCCKIVLTIKIGSEKTTQKQNSDMDLLQILLVIYQLSGFLNWIWLTKNSEPVGSMKEINLKYDP